MQHKSDNKLCFELSGTSYHKFKKSSTQKAQKVQKGNFFVFQIEH